MFFNLYEIYFYQCSKRSHLKGRLNERKGTSRNVRVRKMNFDGRSYVDRFRVPRFLGTEASCQIETASRVIARPLSVARACNRRYPLSEKKVIREGAAGASRYAHPQTIAP